MKNSKMLENHFFFGGGGSWTFDDDRKYVSNLARGER